MHPDPDDTFERWLWAHLYGLSRSGETPTICWPSQIAYDDNVWERMSEAAKASQSTTNSNAGPICRLSLR